MKKISTLFCAGVLMSALCAAVTACNEPNGTELSDEQQRIELAKLTDDVYYVVGSDANTVDLLDDGTAKSWAYLFISENLRDTVGVYNRAEDGRPGPLFDGVFEFPARIMRAGMNGFMLFRKEYRYAYPVRINSHRPLKEDENFPIVAYALFLPSDIHPNKYIVVESLSKIEQ
jgi:hypothetical protein